MSNNIHYSGTITTNIPQTITGTAETQTINIPMTGSTVGNSLGYTYIPLKTGITIYPNEYTYPGTIYPNIYESPPLYTYPNWIGTTIPNPIQPIIGPNYQKLIEKITKELKSGETVESVLELAAKEILEEEEIAAGMSALQEALDRKKTPTNPIIEEKTIEDEILPGTGSQLRRDWKTHQAEITALKQKLEEDAKKLNDTIPILQQAALAIEENKTLKETVIQLKRTNSTNYWSHSKKEWVSGSDKEIEIETLKTENEELKKKLAANEKDYANSILGVIEEKQQREDTIEKLKEERDSLRDNKFYIWDIQSDHFKFTKLNEFREGMVNFDDETSQEDKDAIEFLKAANKSLTSILESHGLTAHPTSVPPKDKDVEWNGKEWVNMPLTAIETHSPSKLNLPAKKLSSSDPFFLFSIIAAGAGIASLTGRDNITKTVLKEIANKTTKENT